MKRYYSETLRKDTPQRAGMLDGLERFLTDSKKKAEQRRENFFSPEKYKNDQNVCREQFIDMLGFPLREKREKGSAQKEFVIRDGNVDIYRINFSFPNGLSLYGLYFQQIEDHQNKPFIFGLHGGAGTAELVSSIYWDSTNYNHLVRRMTDKGASVFAPQLFLWKTADFGNEYDRLEIDGKLRQLGGTVTALEIFLMQSALDYFLEEEHVNENKVGVAGMSYGGMYALHFAAADTRIKSCYSCSWVCDVFKWVKDDWSYQNAQNTFAVAETAGLIAPRPLAVAMGINDPAYQKGTAKESQKILTYYRVFEKAEGFKYVEFEGTHEVDKGDEGLDFLLNALK